MNNRQTDITEIAAVALCLSAFGLLGLIALTHRKERQQRLAGQSNYVLIVHLDEEPSEKISFMDAIRGPKDLLSLDTLLKKAKKVEPDWNI